ncbi:MAG: tRNA 2-selenouridine(34) synthase MnmH [Proteobacteria bacterium]|nr:MAG: tRNA 2-selenouridine(34) synthase MnmH [Pseudomonadota bacterium]
MSSLSASDALDALEAGNHSFIDVRSEVESGKGMIPGFELAPILHDHERHEVGICYKQKGQDAAIELGHKLVDPSRSSRVENWLKIGAKAPDQALLVGCWRGGLRSQIATDWIREVGREVKRIEGGYKAMRADLIGQLNRKPEMIVLGGRSGSGKTALLRELHFPETLDLEAMAAHRGSSFGNVWKKIQPAQASFENALALVIRRSKKPLLLEDESKVIGSLHIPEQFYMGMLKSPLVQIEMPLADRKQLLFVDYVEEPLASGMEKSVLRERLLASLVGMKKRLGGALTADLVQKMETAFKDETIFRSHELHLVWIEKLLNEYYDRAYDHGESLKDRPLLYRGSYEECRQWILNRYV